jgi:ketosteroid isomerase-like protein
MSEKNVQIVRRAFEVSDDLDAVSSFWHEQIEWIEPPESPAMVAVVGAAAAREAMEAWMAMWEKYRYDVEELIGAGDQVIVGGTQAMVARGAEVSSALFFVWTLRDGRAVRARLFLSRSQALDAVGLTG